MTRPRDPGGASVVLLVLLWAVAIVPLASFASAAPSSSDQSGGHDLADMFPERYSRDAGYVSVEVVGSSGTPACRANGTRAVTGTVAIEAGSGSGVYISGATTGEARCTSPRDDHSAPVDANGTPLVELDVHASANRGYFIAPGEVPVKMDGAKVRLEGYPVGAAAGATSVFDDLALDAGLTWVLRASGRVRTRSEDSGGIGEVVFAEGDVHSSATFDADGLFVPGSARARVSASVRVRLGAPEDEGTVGTATTAGARPSRVLLRAVVDYERPGCWDTRAVRADGVEATLSLGGGDADVTLVGDATFFCDANLDGDGKAFRFAVRRGTAGEPLRLKLGGSKRQAVEDVAVAVTGHVAPPAEAAKTLRAMDESSMANASVADAQKLAASSASAESTSETQPGGAAETAAAQGWLPFPDVAGLEISGTIVFVLAEVDKPSPARGLAWIAEASLDRSAGKVDAALELTYVDAPSVDANVQGALVEVATGAVRVHLASGSVRDGCKGGGAAAHGVVRIDARESMRAAFAVFGTRACERDGHAATWEMGATSVADVTVLNGWGNRHLVKPSFFSTALFTLDVCLILFLVPHQNPARVSRPWLTATSF